MKQFISFSILFTLTLLLFTSNLAAAALSSETAEIPYQLNYSDRIVTGTVSRMVEYSNYTIITITVNEWLYNPLPANTIKVRTEMGTNLWTEDEAEFTQNESVLLMLKDKDPDKQLFSVATGFPGKHPISDRDAVIKELKTQGKWQEKNQTVNKTNNNEIEDGVIEYSSNNSEIIDNIPQRLPLTFGPETIDELKSNPDFIAAYGNIPNFSTSEEREQWLDKLDDVYQRAISEMSKYEYPNGPVTSFGYTIDGVIQVGVNRNETVSKPFMDGIYQVFDSKANLIGIKEVPVVFAHEGLAVPCTLVNPVAKSANLSTIENESSAGNESRKSYSVPGFGLLESLTCLYGGWKLRNKVRI